MSKNLTRKGIAFGAAAALGATVFAGTPAFASVNDAAVSLVPSTGTEYSIVQDNVFDLKSDVSVGAVAGSGNLSFLVTDPSEKIAFDYDEDSTNGLTDTRLSLTDLAALNKVVTLAVTALGASATAVDTMTLTDKDGGDDIFAGLTVGDVVEIGSAAGTGTLTSLNGKAVVTALTDADSDGTATVVTIQAATSLTAAANDGDFSAGTFAELTSADALDSRAAILAQTTLGHAAVSGLTAPTRAADKSFVVATGDDDSANSDVLRLVSTAAAGTAVTATVTAWIDENGDGDIDGTEDSSSTRTINFVPWTSAGAALNFEQPVAGLTTFNATVTFDAAINASQITAGRLELGLGRIAPSGSLLSASAGTTVTSGAFTATADTVSWNSTTKKWELGTISAGVASGVEQSYGGAVDISGSYTVLATHTADLDTFTVTAASGTPFAHLAAGDFVKFTTGFDIGSSITATTANETYTVLAATGTTLKFAVNTDLAADITAANTDVTAGIFNVLKFSTARTYASQIILDNAVYGSVAYKTVGAAAVDAAPTTALTRSANAFVGTAGSQSHVRLKATAVQLVASLKKDGKAVGSGVAATVRVTRDSLHADSTITVGGKTLTSTTTAGYVEYEATTNADGKIVIDIANNKGDESDGVTVTVTSSGLASVAHAIDWDVNDYTKYDFTESSAVVNSIKSITKGSAYTLNWNIADEFGVGPAEDWQVKVSYTFLGASQTEVVKFVPFSSGKASLAITDASTAAGSYTVAAVAQKRNTSTGNYEDIDPDNSYFANASTYAFNTTVVVRDLVAASAISLTATSNSGASASLEADDFTSVDYRYNRNQDNTAYDNTEYYTFSGVATDANGAGLPGASVTVSAKGFAFVAGDVSAIDSITVIADASGNYSVKGVSHKAGTYKVTATSGSATKTADATVDNSTTDTDIASVSITALDKIGAGYTAAVKVVVLDKWGNAVKNANAITLTHVGPGYLSAYPSAVSATDGATTFVLISAGARGIANFTVTAAAGSATTDDVTATKSILVGVSAKITKPKKGATATVKYASGATIKVVRGSKSVTKVATSDSQKVTLKSGTGTVSVYVNGVKVASK
jgi:hypothetical protein